MDCERGKVECRFAFASLIKTSSVFGRDPCAHTPSSSSLCWHAQVDFTRKGKRQVKEVPYRVLSCGPMEEVPVGFAGDAGRHKADVMHV